MNTPLTPFDEIYERILTTLPEYCVISCRLQEFGRVIDAEFRTQNQSTYERVGPFTGGTENFLIYKNHMSYLYHEAMIEVGREVFAAYVRI